MYLAIRRTLRIDQTINKLTDAGKPFPVIMEGYHAFSYYAFFKVTKIFTDILEKMHGINKGERDGDIYSGFCCPRPYAPYKLL